MGTIKSTHVHLPPRYRSLTREIATYVLAIELRQSNIHFNFHDSISTAADLLDIEEDHAMYIEKIVGSAILQLADRKKVKL